MSSRRHAWDSDFAQSGGASRPSSARKGPSFGAEIDAGVAHMWTCVLHALTMGSRVHAHQDCFGDSVHFGGTVAQSKRPFLLKREFLYLCLRQMRAPLSDNGLKQRKDLWGGLPGRDPRLGRRRHHMYVAVCDHCIYPVGFRASFFFRVCDRDRQTLVDIPGTSLSMWQRTTRTPSDVGGIVCGQFVS